MPKTPFGGRACPRVCSLLRVMRPRFLVTGLTCFVLVLVLAALPVVAEGGSTFDPTAPCTIKGTNSPNLLVGTAGNDVICGYGGNDTITAKGGNDVVRGGLGADVIYGDAGRDWLYGGPGNDRLFARDSQQDHLYGGTGSDTAHIDGIDVLNSIETHN